MILAGLWYLNEKPNMQLYLKPIIEELSKLETIGREYYNVSLMSNILIGIDILPPGSQKSLRFSLHVISCSCDLPAKTLVLNFNQFYGAYGCGVCEQSGRSYHTEKGGNVRIFRFCNGSPTKNKAGFH